ncbi:MAG: glycosyltransferase [Dysgonamonadaceae bacterium]|jgi:glycosyltransferase involved in cell wall biosynthesis|nr:glycosyltransferase [Dysgonamonadaceae bacterium]
MLVSVIIPIYNVSGYIERCLLSVMNQSYKNIEWVLVDDASPDNSMEMAEKVLNNLPEKENVKIVRHAENRGLAAARNSGVKASTGDYLFFLDSDDELTFDCIEALVSLTENGTADVVTGEIKVVGNKRKAYPQLRLPKGTYSGNDFIFTSFLKREWYEMPCNKLIKRSLFTEKNLWFEEGILHEDTLWSFLLALSARTMTVTHLPTYYYHIRSNSITQKKSAGNVDSFYIVLEKIIQISCREKLFDRYPELTVYLERLRIYFIKSLLRGNFDRPYIREQRNKIDRLYETPVWSSGRRNREFRLKDFVLRLLEYLK